MTFRYLLPLFACTVSLFAQPAPSGTVTGRIVDEGGAQHPIEYAVVTVKESSTDRTVATAATDRDGRFNVDNLPAGNYRVVYGAVGSELTSSPAFTVNPQNPKADLGSLAVPGNVIRLEKVEVATRQEALANSIDRKVYNVGKDLQSATGGASDLLQNIPSVQVDIDGNVSLRGSDSVLILIDGKTSTLMGANRAAALEQMPADSIEKIEVITNPSAKYKPDGTAGIINIVRKKKAAATPGYSGAVRASVGNNRRYNLSANGSLRSGPTSVTASYSLRQDDRERTAQDNRSHVDPTTQRLVTTQQSSYEHSRPLSHIVQVGAEQALNDHNRLGVSGSYNHRSFFRTTRDQNRTVDGSSVTTDYERRRVDPEYEEDVDVRATFAHTFAAPGHELNFDFKHGRTTEQEDNHYTNHYRTPITPDTFDATLIKQTSTGNEAAVEYLRPLPGDAKLESGYTREDNHNDQDHLGSSIDPVTGATVINTNVTNRFLYDDVIHSLFATYGRPWGQFGLLAGLRLEQAYIDLNQVTGRLVNHNNYFRLYPTLHLSYNVSEHGQIQLNYSHRVRRPESDDLNPYPEYQDPYNLRAGNPYLRPEDIHSVEAGYQYKRDDTTYLATVYYRYRYHSFTEVTRFIDSVTLLTTHENLATNRAGGLELAATSGWGDKLTFNASTNVYYNQIDASNLGYSASRSTVTWEGKLNANYRATKSTLVQFNTNFTARRLTPQGDRLPTFVANLGLRHDFPNKKLALILTASDLFNSLKERTKINTPALQREITRRRSSRVVYVGFIYTFGKATKKSKDDSLQFDNAL